MSLLSELKRRILRGGEIITLILFASVLQKGHGKACLPWDEYIITNLQHNAFQQDEKEAVKKFTLYFNCWLYG